MEPALAIIFALSTVLIPMDAREYPTETTSISAGAIMAPTGGAEFSARRYITIGRGFTAFGEGSISTHGDIWASIGARQQFRMSDELSVAVDFGPGVYIRGEGPDLGGVLNFRSGVALVYKIDEVAIELGYDHRSHAGLNGEFNPGLDTAYVSISARF